MCLIMSGLDIRRGSRQAKLAVIVNCTATLLAIIALFTTYWRSSGNLHEGLWCRCIENNCTGFYSTDTHKSRVSDGVDDMFQATQVLVVIGCIFSLGSTIIGVMYACVPPVSSKTTAKFTWVTSLITGLCLMVGLIIFGIKAANKYDLDLSWSFGLGVAACVLHIVVLFVLIPIRHQTEVPEI